MKLLTSLICLLFIAAASAPCGAQPEPKPLPPLPMDDEDVVEEPDVEVETSAVPDSGTAVDPDVVPDVIENAEVESSGEVVCNVDLPAADSDKIERRINRVLKSKHLIGARIGVLAMTYPEGKVLYKRNANELFNPASVMKMFTTAAAMINIGTDARYETAVSVGPGECPGLYLVGGGDPGLGNSEVRGLAKKVAAEGVDCVDAVYYDSSLFDGQALAPHFDEKQSDAHWRPRVGAVGMDDGAFSARVKPGDYQGAAPVVELKPDTGCLLVDSRAVTVDVPGKNKLWVSVSTLDGKVVVNVSGESPMTDPGGAEFKKAVPDPDLFTACYFAEQLARRGVQIRDRALRKGKAPAGSRRVAAVESGPLKDDLKRMQRWSRNFVAEQLVKLMAPSDCRPATFACGLAELRRALQTLNLEPSCMTLGNGSGLFNANRVSPVQVVRLLVELAGREDLGSSYRGFLAAAGASGTLMERMRKLHKKVLGKTGTLDGVSALAGYHLRGKGRFTVFAIIFNDAAAPVFHLRKLQDRVVEILTTWK